MRCGPHGRLAYALCLMKCSAATIAMLALPPASVIAKCRPVQCSKVRLEVQSCKVAVLGANGTLLSSKDLRANLSAGDIRGLRLKGRLISEHAVDCYAGVDEASAKPDAKGSRFFYPSSDLACPQLLRKTVTGKTEHPCCDTGDTHYGTCHSQERLFSGVHKP